MVKLPDPPIGLPYVLMYFGQIVLDQRDAAIAYARPEQRHSAAADQIYVTRDGGAIWSRVTQPEGILVTDPLEAGRVYVFAFDGRTLESRDAGRTWVTVDAPGEVGALGDAVVTRGSRRYALDAGDAKRHDPAQVVATKVGTATLHFRSGVETILEYTAFGRTESRVITRQPF